MKRGRKRTIIITVLAVVFFLWLAIGVYYLIFPSLPIPNRDNIPTSTTTAQVYLHP